MPTTGKTSIQMRDYGNEASVSTFTVATLTAANFDAQATLRGALQSAILGISAVDMLAKIELGNTILNTVVGDDNPLAQRENKWLVQYHETAAPAVKGTVTIPCADLAQLDPNDRAHAEIGDAGVVDAFVAAFEAYVLSENGNAVTIDEITFVGRNT